MTLEYKDINIFYTDQGQGPAIVLLHGFLENSSMWNPFLSKLTKRNRVICIDLLGHGKTKCLGYIHTMEAMAEAVEYVLNSLKIKRIILVGHSMGGYVALAFTEKYITYVNGLVLMNSTYEDDDSNRKQLRARANKMVKTNYNSMVKQSFTNLFSDSSIIKHKAEIEFALQEALKTSIQGYIACNEGMRIRKNRIHVIKNNAFKKMIIISKNDPVLNYKSLVEQSKNTCDKVLILPDGHMSHIENKEVFLQELVHFIEFI